MAPPPYHLLKPTFPPPTTTSTTTSTNSAAAATTTTSAAPTTEPPSLQTLIRSLSLIPHIEGGYFAETDRSPETMASPFPTPPASSTSTTSTTPVTTTLIRPRPSFNPHLRSLSTSIFYLLTPSSPQGGFHRNAARTVHTLHWGRGRYVVIHADRPVDPVTGYHEVESFVVGRNVEGGERLQWVVEGGKFKGSWLLDDEEGGEDKSSKGLLISETVVPGFEYCDHDFLTPGGLEGLLGEEGRRELGWLISPVGREAEEGESDRVSE